LYQKLFKCKILLVHNSLLDKFALILFSLEQRSCILNENYIILVGIILYKCIIYIADGTSFNIYKNLSLIIITYVIKIDIF